MKKSRGKEFPMEIAVGLFMFIALLVMIAFTIVLSTENVFKTYHFMTVQFDDVMGLREGDNVMVRGLQVGKVKSLDLRPDTITVTFALNQPITLREGYQVEVLPASALGGKHVMIFEGPRDAPEISPEVPLVGLSPVDLIDEAGQALRAIHEVLVEGGVLENLKKTMENFQNVTAKLNQGEGTLGRLLVDDSVYVELANVTSNLNVISDRIVKGEGTVGQLLNDDTLYDDLKLVSANLKEVSGRMAKGEGTLGKLLADDKVYDDLSTISTNLRVVSTRLVDGKGMVGKLLSEDDTLYNDLAEAVRLIKDIATAVSSGEGTLGKLAHDDALYVEAKRLLHEIRAAVDDFRETAPITSFTSVFFGAF